MLGRRQKEVRTELRLERYWCDDSAEYEYRLVEYAFDKKGHLIRYKDGDPKLYYLGTGDKEWSRKIAKHYGLSVVEAE